MECNKDIQPIVRLKFGPATKNPIQLDGFIWRTIATSHITSCTTLHNNSLHFENAHAYGTCQLIKGHAPVTLDWINQASLGPRDTHYLILMGWSQTSLNTFTLLTSLLNINLRWNAHASLHDWTYLKNILHHRYYWLLAVCLRRLHMECSSHSTTVLDKWFQSPDTQQHYWKGVHSLLLQWFCPDPATCRRKSIIWSLVDHLDQCLWMASLLRRYRIRDWEWKPKCSHPSTLRKKTISCFNTRKFLFWTCHTHLLVTYTHCTTDWLMKRMMNLHLITYLRMTCWITDYLA